MYPGGCADGAGVMGFQDIYAFSINYLYNFTLDTYI